jgi:hypothetical protein
VTSKDRQQLREQVDKEKRRRLHMSRAATKADLEMWRKADEREAREREEAA